MGWDGEGKFRVSNWMLTCGLNIYIFYIGPLLCVLLLDYHYAMHAELFVEVMRSPKHVILLQLCCVQLCYVAAVFGDNVCFITTHNRPTHIHNTTAQYAEHSKKPFRHTSSYTRSFCFFRGSRS